MEKEYIERWKPCTRYPSYYVSTLGNVRHKARFKNLKQQMSQGYRQVSPYIRGKCKAIRVHILVALEFCEGFSEGKNVNHIDGDKLNNQYQNLEWVTQKENVHHAMRNNLSNFNKPDRCRRLDDIQLLTMLTLETKMSDAAIGRLFKVAKNTLPNIRAGRKHKHLTPIAREVYAN